MITTSSIPHISRMLNEPRSIKETDHETIAALLNSYPYFLPARYMDAAIRHQKQPFNSSMMTMMQLYKGNWLLFWQYLQEAIGKDAHTEYYKEFNLKQTQQETATENIFENIHDEHKESSGSITTDIEELETEETKEDTFNPIEEVELITAETDDTLILPIYTEDYFLHQGIQVENNIPDDIELSDEEKNEEDKSLMVVMSFSEWLGYFKTKNEKEKEEEEDQKALKTMWQKGKLAAALEEENEEIPEAVFEMAVNSITKEEDLVSESLADIYIKQGKYDKAIEMYRKLSLRNPQKNAYFARKIDAIIKEK